MRSPLAGLFAFFSPQTGRVAPPEAMEGAPRGAGVAGRRKSLGHGDARLGPDFLRAMPPACVAPSCYLPCNIDLFWELPPQ